ncbi:MAG: hypothetical protein JJU05_18065 [Verrucomicrobia bacterium]|nr:hypothetical protein [Verrucomicrobiota bacterium]MCH8529074.1 hypothetical protein [Kiritimatiellia bacterium]
MIIKHIYIFIISVIYISTFARAETVEVYREGRWEPRAVAPLPASQPVEVEKTVYGGKRTGNHRGTGFFRVEEVEGRWWFIDPDGGRFVSRGLNSVNPGDETAYRKNQGLPPLEPREWAARSRETILRAGFNTLGSWSSAGHFSEPELRMPHTPTLHLASAFGFSIGGAYARFGNTGFTHGVVPVFHPDFVDFIKKEAQRRIGDMRDDPWVIGFYSDNELPFRHDGMIGRYLDFPKEDMNHIEARKYLENKYGRFNPADITDADDRAFTSHVLETYFSAAREAIREAAPNHLILGSRFHGMALHNRDLFRVAGRHVDVISVNYYHRWDVEADRLASWTRLSNRPVLITEFYARRIPGPKMDGQGAGFRVRQEGARGLFYRNFAPALAKAPGCVGWHWHRFSDYESAGDGVFQGIVQASGAAHEQLIKSMRETNDALLIFMTD